MSTETMTETRKLRPIGRLYCKQYETNADFFIQDEHPSGNQHLVVQYEKGGYEDQPEFAAAIPEEWTESDIHSLLLLPMKERQSRNWPAWEVPARDYGSSTLFRWWAGERFEKGKVRVT